MNSRSLKLFFIVLFFLLGITSSGCGDQGRSPVIIPGKNNLHLRVLTRPYSTVYMDKVKDNRIIMDNVPAFTPYFVYSIFFQENPDKSEINEKWYEVGTDDKGKIIGWMREKDVFEWKQTLCLAFTHPMGRKPVLMFKNKNDLLDLVQTNPATRRNKAENIYRAIENERIPPNFPVISIEPKRMINKTNEFYLLPILDFARSWLMNGKVE